MDAFFLNRTRMDIKPRTNTGYNFTRYLLMRMVKRMLISHDHRSHYGDVIMGSMASQITNLMMVYSSVYSGRSKKTSKLHVTGLCARNSPVTGEFPAQMTSNAKYVWWRHDGFCSFHVYWYWWPSPTQSSFNMLKCVKKVLSHIPRDWYYLYFESASTRAGGITIQ